MALPVPVQAFQQQLMLCRKMKEYVPKMPKEDNRESR